MSRIASGTIKTGWMNPFSARSMYIAGGELKVKRETDFGIIDSILVLQLTRP